MGLKRRTASNIVIGGAAGCFPVLVGWAAVTGTVSWPAIVLFAIIFFWTPPHFWALAMKFKDDYAVAGVPMLPVVATAATVARKILFYSYVMVAVTLALAPYAGWAYGICAGGLGAWFLIEAHRLRSRVSAGEARRADAAVPSVDRLPDPALRCGRRDRAAAQRVSVAVTAGRARPRWMILLRPRWLAWHAFAVLAFAGMLWLGDWQLRRAESGNELSWAYTFEWPLFAICGGYFWVRSLREELRSTRAPRPPGNRGAGAGGTVSAARPGRTLTRPPRRPMSRG